MKDRDDLKQALLKQVPDLIVYLVTEQQLPTREVVRSATPSELSAHESTERTVTAERRSSKKPVSTWLRLPIN